MDNHTPPFWFLVGRKGGRMTKKEVSKEDVFEAFRSGLAPSQVDRDLGLTRGAAKAAIVKQWRMEGKL